MAVDDDHLLEAVVRQTLADIGHVLYEVLEMDVYGSWKVHDVMDITIGHRRHDETDIRPLSGRLTGYCIRTRVVDLQWKMRPMLFH